MRIIVLSFILFMTESLQAQYRYSDDRDEESFYENEEGHQNTVTVNTRHHPQWMSSSSHQETSETDSSAFLEQRVSVLENELRKLRGLVEEVQHLVKSRKPLFTESRTNSSTATEDRITARNSDPDDAIDQDAERNSPLNDRPAFRQYEEAQHLLNQENFLEAERILKDILKNYPHDPLIINVHYWLGEIYYTQKNYTQAAVAFGETYKAYRQLDKASNALQKDARKMGFAKAPEALVKLALSFKALGQVNQACVTLDQLRSEFPQLSDPVKRLTETVEQGLSCKSASPKK